MKKLAAVLMCLCLIAVFPITAYASQSDANISTVVPDTHNITVVSDGAQVFFGGAPGSSFTVERLSEPTLLIRPDSEKTVKQILLNGEDVTSLVKGGYYTLAPVYEDKTLTVVTEDLPQSDKPDSKTYTVKGTVIRNGQPVEGVTLELRSPLKTGVTDKNGSFMFENVARGSYTLTATENGLVVGYVEFELAESEETSLSLTDAGVYNITVNQDEIGIHLDLHLNEDNTMQIESVSGIEDNSKDNRNTGEKDIEGSIKTSTDDTANVKTGADSNSPLTGDRSYAMLSLLIVLAMIASFVFVGFYGKNKKDNR